MIMDNENKTLSRIRKRRIERRKKIDDKMKSLLKKLKLKRKTEIKLFINLKTKKLNCQLVKSKYVKNPNLLESNLKELSKDHVIDKNLSEIKK